MRIFNNRGELIGEITTIVRPGEGVITTNTVYSGDRVVVQHISTRDETGKVHTEDFFGGKILP